ncbi:MAG: DUF167 family protein [Candidatus Nucleicultricaceae bacterium]
MKNRNQEKEFSPLLYTEKHGWTIAIRLTPHASKDSIKGIYVDEKGRLYLKASVRAVPEDGKANKAIIRLMAKEWKIPASTITLITGDTGRLKIFSLHTISDHLKSAILTEIALIKP